MKIQSNCYVQLDCIFYFFYIANELTVIALLDETSRRRGLTDINIKIRRMNELKNKVFKASELKKLRKFVLFSSQRPPNQRKQIFSNFRSDKG